MKNLFLLIIYSSFFMQGFSQSTEQRTIDSLFQVFASSEKTTQTVDLFNQLISDNFIARSSQEADSAVIVQEKNIDLARELNYKSGLASSLYLLGRYHISVSNNYAKATPALLESLSIYEEEGNNEGCSRCHMQLAVISYMLQYYEDAVKNLTLSLEYNNEPVSQYLLALSYSELGNFQEAKKYFNLTVDNYKKIGDTKRLSETYSYLGKLYENEKDLDSALYYLNMAIEGVEKYGSKSDFRRPYALISSVYLKSGDVKRAIQYAELSYDMNRSGSDIISRIEALSTLSKAYALTGNHKKAYKYLEQHNEINGTYVQGSTKQKVADMQSMFDFKKKINEEKIRNQKDKEIAEERIQKERILRNAFIVGTIFLLLMSLILYNRYTIKRNSEIALTEKNAIIQNEKDRSDKLLLNILPVEIAEELKNKGKADARDFEMVSILFTDFKEFTQTSEKLSAQELVAEINTCYAAFDQICAKYNIEKIKTIGDSYMAAGGLPVPRADSVKNTVLAAIEMQGFMVHGARRTVQGSEGGGRKADSGNLNTEQETRNTEHRTPKADSRLFEMRVGIHTGPVVAGIVGVKKFQYDIWGDTVNTASRAESESEVGKVNITAATYNLIKDDPQFSFESRGKISAKGKGEIEMYFVHLR